MKSFRSALFLGTFCAFCMTVRVVGGPIADGKPASTKPKTEFPLLPTDLREWTSSDGQKTKGKLLSVDLEKKVIVMELESGKKLEGVPMARFCKADQEYFSQCRTQQSGLGQDGKITRVDEKDPEMAKAKEEARKTFAAAWKEIQKDQQRILPLLSMVAIKAGFQTDKKPGTDDKKAPEQEMMWVMDFSFDGKRIKGVLGNEPDHIASLKQGQEVEISLDDLCDWIYSDGKKIHGAYTEKLIHRRMSAEEKQEHNKATGVNWDED